MSRIPEQVKRLDMSAYLLKLLTFYARWLKLKTEHEVQSCKSPITTSLLRIYINADHALTNQLGQTDMQ